MLEILTSSAKHIIRLLNAEREILAESVGRLRVCLAEGQYTVQIQPPLGRLRETPVIVSASESFLGKKPDRFNSSEPQLSFS